MIKLRSFRVSFWIRDRYTIHVTANTTVSALETAKALYFKHGEDPAVGFQFDITEGGAEKWEAQEVLS